MKTPLQLITEAAIDVSELVRGVEGEVDIEGVAAIHCAQSLIVRSGWKRASKLEGFSKLEHRVYVRGKRDKRRYLTITIGHLLGVFAIVRVTQRKP